MKRRIRLLVFSTAPFCHGKFGSQNQLLAAERVFQSPKAGKLGTAVKRKTSPCQGWQG